jgi:hypothetical protein
MQTRASSVLAGKVSTTQPPIIFSRENAKTVLKLEYFERHDRNSRPKCESCTSATKKKDMNHGRNGIPVLVDFDGGPSQEVGDARQHVGMGRTLDCHPGWVNSRLSTIHCLTAPFVLFLVRRRLLEWRASVDIRHTSTTPTVCCVQTRALNSIKCRCMED